MTSREEREARRVIVDVPADLTSQFLALFGSARLKDGVMTYDPEMDWSKAVARWLRPDKIEALRARLASKKTADK